MSLCHQKFLLQARETAAGSLICGGVEMIRICAGLTAVTFRQFGLFRRYDYGSYVRLGSPSTHLVLKRGSATACRSELLGFHLDVPFAGVFSDEFLAAQRLHRNRAVVQRKLHNCLYFVA